MTKRSGNGKWSVGAIAAMVGLVAVCVPCCAALIAPAIAGLSVALGLGAYADSPLSWQAGAALAALAGAIGMEAWRRRTRARQCGRDGQACGCGQDSR